MLAYDLYLSKFIDACRRVAEVGWREIYNPPSSIFCHVEVLSIYVLLVMWRYVLNYIMCLLALYICRSLSMLVEELAKLVEEKYWYVALHFQLYHVFVCATYLPRFVDACRSVGEVGWREILICGVIFSIMSCVCLRFIYAEVCRCLSKSWRSWLKRNIDMWRYILNYIMFLLALYICRSLSMIVEELAKLVGWRPKFVDACRSVGEVGWREILICGAIFSIMSYVYLRYISAEVCRLLPKSSRSWLKTEVCRCLSIRWQSWLKINIDMWRYILNYVMCLLAIYICRSLSMLVEELAKLVEEKYWFVALYFHLYHVFACAIYLPKFVDACRRVGEVGWREI